MGTDLKGRNIGKGITQRKDKKYYARITLKNGKIDGKLFDKLNEAKKWLIDRTYEDRHSNNVVDKEIFVNDWFDYWIENAKKNTVKVATLDNYMNKYRLYISEYIGNMIIGDVKLVHCQNIINQLHNQGKSMKTIKLVKAILYDLFKYATLNYIIPINPVSENLKLPKGNQKEPRVLTIEEQEMLLDKRSDTENGYVYSFILQTGLRFGEVMALKWEDIDYENECIVLRNNAYFDQANKEYIFYSPKSESGYRNIPLTKKALMILRKKKEAIAKVKCVDYRYIGCVFLNERGTLSLASRYNKDLKKFAKDYEIESFSLHSLRHTFATRCIEAGMKPKTLQKILGHSNISITMNLYVHVTDEERKNEMEKFEKYDKITKNVINL